MCQGIQQDKGNSIRPSQPRVLDRLVTFLLASEMDQETSLSPAAYVAHPSCLPTPNQSPNCSWWAATCGVWAETVPGLHQQLSSVALCLCPAWWSGTGEAIWAVLLYLHCSLQKAKAQRVGWGKRFGAHKREDKGRYFDKHILGNSAQLWSRPKTSHNVLSGPNFPFSSFHFFFLSFSSSSSHYQSFCPVVSRRHWPVSCCKGTKPSAHISEGPGKSRTLYEITYFTYFLYAITWIQKWIYNIFVFMCFSVLPERESQL